MEQTKSKYLVRPDDHHIFELDPFNGCYRSYFNRDIKNRPHAMKHFTFEILTNNYGWIPIVKSDIPHYEALNKRWGEIWTKCQESDGHGGIKGRSNLTPEEIEFINLQKD
jgi:hypothetical protein